MSAEPSDDHCGHVACSPRATIILTFYNNEQYVAHALNMVLAQSFRDYQLVVVDDGSTDRTVERIRELTSGLRNVDLVLRPSNQGVASARNEGVRAALGEYVWFVDCDDEWSPEILGRLVSAASREDADVAICRAVRASHSHDRHQVLLDGLELDITASRPEAIGMIISGQIRGYLWNKVIRTSLLKANPFPFLTSQSDLAGIIKVVAQAERVTFVSDVLYTHLVRPGSITNSRNPNLKNLEICWQAARTLAVSSGLYDTDDDALVYYDYWQYYAAVINTYHRVGADDRASNVRVRAVRAQMTVRGLRIVARRDKRLALVCGLMKATGPVYSRIYSSYRAIARR